MEMLKGCRVNNCEYDSSCAIYLEEFTIDGNDPTYGTVTSLIGGESFVVRTPCSHEFHEECALTWLHKTPTCPLCRFDIMSILNEKEKPLSDLFLPFFFFKYSLICFEYSSLYLFI